MIKYFENLARALLGMKFSELSEEEQRVIESIANREPVAENVNEIFIEELTYGQRLADKVVRFGGSWPFITIFLLFMIVWVLINSYLLVDPFKPFDPYPYILLNLALSTLAALQAPVIMMTQNRQAAKDRVEMDANYQVSLKMDLEIMHLHEKLDKLASPPNGQASISDD